MDFLNFISESETYLNKMDSVKYLNKEHDIPPHKARELLKGVFSAKSTP